MGANRNGRKHEIDFLLRSNTGRKRVHELRNVLETVLRTSVDFLPLKRSDEIRNRLSLVFRRNPELGKLADSNFESDLHYLSREEAKSLSLVPPQEEVLFLILPEANKVGIPEIQAPLLNEHWLSLLDSLPDGFQIANPSFRNWCVIQKIEEAPLWDERIEIYVAGAQWIDWISRQMQS